MSKPNFIAIVCFWTLTTIVGASDILGRAEYDVDRTRAAFADAKAHHDAITELAARGHASHAELSAARKSLGIADAELALATRWRVIAESVAAGPSTLEVRPVIGSLLMFLPAVIAVDAEAPNDAALRSLHFVLLSERDSLPRELVAFDVTAVAAYQRAESGIPIRDDDGEPVAEQHNALVREQIDMQQRFDRLTLTIERLGVDVQSEDLMSRRGFDQISQAVADAHGGFYRTAITHAAEYWLRAERDASVANVELAESRDWLSRLQAVSPEFLRPQEMGVAERRVRRAELVAKFAERRLHAADLAIVFLSEQNARGVAIDWSAYVGDRDEPMWYVDFTMPARLPIESQTLGVVDLQGRDVEWHASQARTNTSSQSLWSDNTRMGIARRVSDRDRTHSYLQPAASHRTAYARIGFRYRTGYVNGQVRSDLPFRLRTPRADAYGGPWYLPGSPTNELRFRNRLPLEAR